MRKFGEGDTAIAAYVRKHHPEIIEQAVAWQKKEKRKALKKAWAANAEKRRPLKEARAQKLIAELATLGIFVHEAAQNGAHSSRKRLALR